MINMSEMNEPSTVKQLKLLYQKIDKLFRNRHTIDTSRVLSDEKGGLRLEIIIDAERSISLQPNNLDWVKKGFTELWVGIGKDVTFGLKYSIQNPKALVNMIMEDLGFKPEEHPKPTTQIMYGHKHTYEVDGTIYYDDITESAWSTELYGDDAVSRLEVSIHPDQTPESRDTGCGIDYWGWVKKENPDQFIFVYPSFPQFSMVFPYGFEGKEERGRGKAYRLVVKEA